jgi:hypothetical protein
MYKSRSKSRIFLKLVDFREIVIEKKAILSTEAMFFHKEVLTLPVSVISGIS